MPSGLAECGVAGPLVDLVKLEDIAADHVATLSGPRSSRAFLAWAARTTRSWSSVLDAARDEALRR